MTNQRIEDREPPGEGAGPARRPRGSLGTWLRAQREARGVSLREIADDSKISLRYLEALEADRFAVLPAPVFTRGFLREYARIVGLDGDEVVNLYLQVAPPREPESGESPLAPPAGVALRRSGEGRGLGPVLLVALLLLAGLVALLVWWLRREAPPAGPAARPPSVAAPVSAAVPASGAEPASDGESAAADQSEAFPTEAARDAAPTPAEVTPVAEPDPRESGSPPPVAEPAAVAATGEAGSDPATPEPLRIVLEFSQDCWVEFAVDGGRRTSELRAAGEVVTLVAQDHVLLTLGNLAGVGVSIDGRPWTPPGGAARVTRDLRIDRTTVAGTP